MTLLNAFYLTAHLLLKPYRNSFQNHLESASLFVLVVISAILIAEPPPFISSVAIILSILVIVPTILLGAALGIHRVATTAKRRFTQRQQQEQQMHSGAETEMAESSGPPVLQGLTLFCLFLSRDPLCAVSTLTTGADDPTIH